jgi:hypothetical protein
LGVQNGALNVNLAVRRIPAWWITVVVGAVDLGTSGASPPELVSVISSRVANGDNALAFLKPPDGEAAAAQLVNPLRRFR